MKRVKVKNWEELDALPEGEWVEVVGGLDLEVIDLTTRKKGAAVTIRPKASAARGPQRVSRRSKSN